MNKEEFIKQFCIAAAPQMLADWRTKDLGNVMKDTISMAEFMADELEKKFYFA